MSIRFRLVISYIAMVIIPIILTVIAALVILAVFMGGRSHGRIKGDFFRDITERAIKLSREVGDIARSNPDKLKDTDTLKALDRQFSLNSMGMTVKHEDKVIFTSESFEGHALLEKLAGFKGKGADHLDMIEVDDKMFAVNQTDLQFSDGTKGSIFLFTDISGVGKFTVAYFSTLGWAILIIIMLTNGVITYYVSRSIIRPLGVLKYGTDQIKQGNLNFELNCRTRDEIGQVCIAFDEMRKKLKESIDRQLQYDENRKELVSSISHDLKTPITSIKGYVEGIIDGVADTPEKMDRYIRTIYSKATDMDKLIDDLFLFSKLDLKKMPFDFEKVNITKYFEDCIEEKRLDTENKNIRIEFNPEVPGSTEVIADREKLKRVINNIIENAVKYMDKTEGKITVHLKEEETSVKVAIEDNGPGINSEELPFIFDRFYRADLSRNTSTGGSGLGLAIAKQIIEGHEGVIWAESEAGSGTRVCFTLRVYRRDFLEKNIDN